MTNDNTNSIPEIAEAKDSIIQLLQEQIRNLQTENKSLKDTMISSFKETQDLQRIQIEELQKLRADTVNLVAQPIVAEPVAEAKNPVTTFYETKYKEILRERNKYFNDLVELKIANKDYFLQCEEKSLTLLEAKQKLEHELYLRGHPNYRSPGVPLDRFPQGYVPYVSGGHPSASPPYFGSLPYDYTLIEPPHPISGGGIERITRQPCGIKPGSRYMQEIYYPPNSAGNGYKPSSYETTFKTFAENTEEYNRKRGIR